MAQIFNPARNMVRRANSATGGDTLQGASNTGLETVDNNGGAGGNPLVVVASPNPFGFNGFAELKGDAAVADPLLVYTRESVGTFPANGTWTVFSFFVKKPTTGTPMTQFTASIKGENGTLLDHKAGFKWVGTELQRDTTLDAFLASEENFKVTIKPFTNGWYRVGVSYMVSTKAGDTTVAGNSRRMWIRGVDADLSNKVLWLFGWHVEDKTSDWTLSDYFTGGSIDDFLMRPAGDFHATLGRVQISVVPGQNITAQVWARVSPTHPWVKVLEKTQADLDATTGTGIFACEVEPEMLVQFGVDPITASAPSVSVALP